MARCVALVRFANGGELFCVYCNTTDLIVGRELFDTAELAEAAREAHEEAFNRRGTSVQQVQAPAGVEASEERATVYPNGRYNDLRFEFQTRASRRHRWITGPRGFDDMVKDHSDDGFFWPPPKTIE
jgi:hypothetical protein